MVIKMILYYITKEGEPIFVHNPVKIEIYEKHKDR